MSETKSYYALRVRGGAEEWWSAALAAKASAPPAVRALLSGRSRVEVTAEEGDEALAWASRLDAGVSPLWLYSR